jgi:hypothetical protein
VDVVDLASLDAGEPPKFQQRQFIFDSRVIETLLIIPL